MAQDRQRDQLVAVLHGDAAHAHGAAALEHPHVGDREADALAVRRRQQHVVALGGDLHVDDRLALVELHGDHAGAPHVDEIGQLVAPHGAAGGGEHDVEIGPARLVLGQRHDGGDALVLLQRQDVDHRLAARLGRRQRQPPHLFLVDLAARGEEQHRRVGVGDEQPRDEILLAGLHAGAALAAAALRPVGRQRHALDIAVMGDGDDHVLALDQVLVLHLAFLIDDHGAARGGELVLDLDHLGLDDRLDAGAGAQDVEIVGDLGGELVEFLLDLLAPERGEALQPQIEDRARLFVGEPRGAGRRHPVARIVDQLDQRRPPWSAGHSRAISASRAAFGSGAERISRITSSILATAMARPTRIWARSRALLSRNLVRRDTTSSRNATKAVSRSLSVHHLRAAAIERHHVGAEGRLQRGEAVELVEHHVGHRVAPQLDHDAIAVAVGLVAQIGYALDLLLAHQLGDLLHHRRLVHLIGNLGDDDGFALLAQRLDLGLAAHDDGAAAEVIGGADAGAAEDERRRSGNPGRV